MSATEQTYTDFINDINVKATKDIVAKLNAKLNYNCAYGDKGNAFCIKGEDESTVEDIVKDFHHDGRKFNVEVGGFRVGDLVFFLVPDIGPAKVLLKERLVEEKLIDGNDFVVSTSKDDPESGFYDNESRIYKVVKDFEHLGFRFGYHLSLGGEFSLEAPDGLYFQFYF